MIDETLACEDANSKLVGVVTVANVDDEDRVGNSLLQIWKLTFGPKDTLLFRLILPLMFLEFMKNNLGRDSEDEILSRFGFELVRTLVS